MSFRERMYRFMMGRYGQDQLGSFLIGTALVMCVLSWFTTDYLYLLSLAILVYAYFRIFSRNRSARARENSWYLSKTYRIRNWIAKQKLQTQQNAGYRIFKCPQCKQKLRLPKGRGKIEIRCRACGHQFIRRT